MMMLLLFKKLWFDALCFGLRRTAIIHMAGISLPLQFYNHDDHYHDDHDDDDDADDDGENDDDESDG